MLWKPLVDKSFHGIAFNNLCGSILSVGIADGYPRMGSRDAQPRSTRRQVKRRRVNTVAMYAPASA